MRIFIHNVDSYLGKALVKELRRADGGLNRIFGTAINASEAPSAVKRIVSKDDPKKAKKMAETIQSCRLVIMDLFGSSLEDIYFAFSALKVDYKSSPPKSTGELEGEVTFILISSLMVWAGTQAASEDGFLRDSDYLTRRPTAGSKYEQWKEHEDLVLSCFNREGSQVKGFVVAGGALYGEGEAGFAQMFKDAWRGVQEHVILAPGTNRVPTVHVRDLARLVRHIGTTSDTISPMEATPYFLAVDQPPAPEGQRPKPPTQMDIVQGIVDEVSEHYEVPIINIEPSAASEAAAIEDQLAINLCVEPSAIMLNPDFAATSDPPGWLCRDGFVASIRTIADEFCQGKKLRAMRILIAGPPGGCQSQLAKAVAEQFKVPHLELHREALEQMKTQLTSNVCRYRGYVLDAGTIGFDEAEKLFRFDVEVPRTDEDDVPPTDGADGDVQEKPKQFERRLDEEMCPSFIVVTQAPAAVCKAKWQAEGGRDLKEFDLCMQQYKRDNLTEDQHSLSDFFMDIARVGVLNLPISGKDQEDLFESVRIYVERAGRPFNYLPSADEVANEIRAQRQEKAQQAADAASSAASRQKDSSDLHEEKRLNAERLRIISEHEAAQQQLKDMPLREYLMRYTVPNLTEGLIEMCKVLPENPVDYLAVYLEQHASELVS